MRAYLAFCAPFIGFCLTALSMWGRHTPSRIRDAFANVTTCTCMIISSLMSWSLLWSWSGGDIASHILPLWTWLDAAPLHISFGLMLDHTSILMMTMVTTVSTLVHIYSIGYMSHDASIPRFMAYLSLFTFFMLILVLAPNLPQLFVGWEGVGLASYLLIGFWYHKPSASAASIKAFVTNRVGDAGLVIGFAALFYVMQTFEIHDINTFAGKIASGAHTVPNLELWGLSIPMIPLICAALFIGVMGKSAQFGLHTWLPDAMEGPTPVSALIHAATMVTAGVYLLIRLHPLFALSIGVQSFIAIMGALTCFFAATVAMVQDDIKRVIAYSTCSQLGYMVMAAGMNVPDAAFFHLITHGAFKALLFLGAGSVIHALSDEQNIEKMGGLYRHIPFTYVMMWIGSLALAGVPFFSGFYSKDSILVGTYAAASTFSPTLTHALYAVGVLVAFMTALYSWRLLIKVFHGEERADEHVMAHVHESPWVMRIPLLGLALGATFVGVLSESTFIHTHAHVPNIILQMPIIVAISGIAFGYYFFFLFPHQAFNLTRYFKYIYVLFINKWFFDKIYTRVFVHGALKLGGVLWQRIDIGLIDRLGPNGAVSITQRISHRVCQLQTGYLFHYAFAMMVGMILFISYLCLVGGA